MTVTAQYYTRDGNPVSGGEFSLIAKSQSIAESDIIKITGLSVVLRANNFIVFGDERKRLIASKESR